MKKTFTLCQIAIDLPFQNEQLTVHDLPLSNDGEHDPIEIRSFSCRDRKKHLARCSAFHFQHKLFFQLFITHGPKAVGVGPYPLLFLFQKCRHAIAIQTANR